MNIPDWLGRTLIGAGIGYLFPLLMKLVLYTLRSFKKDLVTGIWHVYHSTIKDEKAHLEESIWTIKKGFLSKYKVIECKIPNNETLYKGNISFERNFWIVHLKAVKHQEEIVIRLFSPITAADEKTWGIYLGLDYRGEPASGVVVVSKNELINNKISSYVSSKVHANDKIKMIFV